MTIKQQGGIFGRNPTFNDVTIDGTLTTSGALSFDEVDVDNIKIDGNTISSTDTNGNINITPNGSGKTLLNGTAIGGLFSSRFYFGAGDVGLWYDTSNKAIRAFDPSTPTLNNGNIDLGLADTRFKDIHLAGNVVIGTSGKGIDFSATSGTGTSELFDDYEEGSYTVSLHDGSSGGNASSTTTTGYYTKVGRVVTCSFSSLSNISTAGMTTSNVLYMSLPFDAAQSASGSMAISVVDARQASGQGYVVPVVVSGNSRARFYGCQSGNANASIRPAELTSGTSDFVNFTMTYIAS